MYYKHTQIGWLPIFVVGGLLVVLACATARIPEPQALGGELLLSGIGLILVFCLVIFGSMTVTVNNVAITVQFGPGPIRKTIELADIELCRPVRNRWWWGWGIRRVPSGWLYNVSGLDAVELVMKDGRVFRIGSDEPQALADFIQRKLERIAQGFFAGALR